MELTLINVNKVFAGKKAVNDVSLKIGYGIHGLLGANGAGNNINENDMWNIRTY